MTGTAVSFGTLDWTIVGLYFVANTAICVWAALKKEKDTADYFLASRSAGWFLIGSSIFASNVCVSFALAVSTVCPSFS